MHLNLETVKIQNCEFTPNVKASRFLEIDSKDTTISKFTILGEQKITGNLFDIKGDRVEVSDISFDKIELDILEESILMQF